ncbi:MAG TPA: hypothetical protein PKC49_03060, partial [Phycisphaerae bacterium]|nr:hypothetical protein [Phycisphaerae bacterium]
MCYSPCVMANELVGWIGILAGFLSGAVLGLGFRGEAWLGGYASWPRRLLRLGHIALVALGALNLLVAHSLQRLTFDDAGRMLASGCFIFGGLAMPIACFLAAWRKGLYPAFFPPVAALIAGAVVMLLGACR